LVFIIRNLIIRFDEQIVCAAGKRQRRLATEIRKGWRARSGRFPLGLNRLQRRRREISPLPLWERGRG
jgi:hypothetical protein